MFPEACKKDLNVCHYFKGINAVIWKQASGLAINPGQNIRVTDEKFSLQLSAINHATWSGFMENSSSGSHRILFQPILTQKVKQNKVDY